jgi:predicted nucleic acid-binding protein
MIVIDASALIELLLQTRVGQQVTQELLHSDDTIHAPHLIDVEVAQVLRRLVREKEITSDRAEEALLDLREFDLERHPHDVLLERVWSLRGKLSAYDAVYVALAEGMNAALLTTDHRLARAAGSSVKVQTPQPQGGKRP